MFAESTNQKKDEKKKDEPTTTKQKEHEVGAVVVPRKRRVVRKQRILETTPNAILIPSSTPPAKVSMADCLACSGCVTTAETVLVEQHSLQKLRQALQENDNDQQRPVVFTISPASWADLLRKLELRPSLDIQRKLASFLQQTCRAVVVLDGHVPLQWSLQEAAREFCRAYKRKQFQESTIPPPSMAVSSNRIQYGDGVIVECHTREESRIPLLTSTCPALVCLVEKSRPEAVPHLATTKSPMSMAGAYFSQKNYFHVGIMPCHDKKLEASRKDLHEEKKPHVDLVITTQEWWTLLTDTVMSESVVDVNAYLQNLPMANVATSVKAGVENAAGGVTLVVVVPPVSDAIAGKEEEDVIMMDADSQQFFPFGSGGYADFIFRFASQELFGYTVEGELSWTPIETPQARRVASSRVAASLQKRRDFLSVTLYRRVDGSYSSLQQSGQDEPVLRFATAYGLQNIQRALLPFSSSGVSSTALSFDYVEAMACPSGCPNGGGQVREGNIRESPTETRERVTKTQEIMKMQRSNGHDSNPLLDYPSDLIPTGPFGLEAKRLLHTRFHVVPPLQHSMGAAAGVAVQDTQW
jgi:iron only hydrogenase large subunit-like protein